jgi:Na+-transporting methylmalonyl-CoA/oxaloacetate decarboxylase gamma subunit
MIYILIPLLFVAIIIYVLYRIGKDVKRKEEQFKKMFDDQNAKNNLKKYKRKSTPKVTTIKK